MVISTRGFSVHIPSWKKRTWKLKTKEKKLYCGINKLLLLLGIGVELSWLADSVRSLRFKWTTVSHSSILGHSYLFIVGTFFFCFDDHLSIYICFGGCVKVFFFSCRYNIFHVIHWNKAFRCYFAWCLNTTFFKWSVFIWIAHYNLHLVIRLTVTTFIFMYVFCRIITYDTGKLWIFHNRISPFSKKWMNHW